MMTVNRLHKIGQRTISRMKAVCKDLARPNQVLCIVTDDNKVGLTTTYAITKHLRESGNDHSILSESKHVGIAFKGFIPEFILSNRLEEDELEVQVQRFYAHLR